MAVYINMGFGVSGSGSGYGSGSGSGSGSGNTGPNGANVTGSLSMTLPKYGYTYGETFSTTHAKVIFTPFNGEPVTVYDPSQGIDLGVSFDPSSGSSLTDTGDVTVTASYTPEGSDEIRTVSVISVFPNVESKGVLNFTPSKTEWNYGETYDTSGAVVTYSPTGGTQVTVWDPSQGIDLGVSFDPSSGSKLDTPGQLTLKASYTPDGAPEVNRTVVATVKEPREDQVSGTLTINLPKTEFRYGETFSTSGVSIIFTPTNGEQVDVTLKAISSLSPSNDTQLTNAGPIRVTASYTPAYGSTVYGETYIYVAEQAKGFLSATMSRSEYVHGDQFNQSVVEVKYFDPLTGESEVLDNSLVTFSPSNGSTLDIDGENKLIISYDPHSTVQNPDPISLVFRVTPIIKSSRLQLGDNGMRVNENVSYKGSVLSVTYSDGSVKDIYYGNPGLVWSPLEGTQITSVGNTSVSVEYTENSQTVSANAEINVSALNLSDIIINVPRREYYAGEQLELAMASAFAVYDDQSTKDITDSIKWNKNDGTTLTDTFVLVGTYTENGSTKTAYTTITVVPVEGEKTKPGSGNLIISMSRSTYKSGETYGDIYRCATVKCPMTDGTFTDVTDKVTWADGESVVLASSGNITIKCELIIYDGSTMSGSVTVNVTDLKLTGLGLALNKQTFESGEVINYTSLGAVVHAMYEDGSTKVVEPSKCTWNPSDGAQVTANNDNITVTYTENGETKSASRQISVSDKLSGLQVILAKTEYVPGESISYDGSTIIANFESGATKQLQVHEVSWTPASGTRLNADGSQNVVASYTFGTTTEYWNGSVSVRNQSSGGGSDSGSDSGSGGSSSGGGSGSGSGSGSNNPLKSIDVTLGTTLYNFGDHISYDDAVVEATYKNGTTKTIPVSAVTWDPEEGSVLTKVGSYTVTATYGDGDSADWTGSVEVESNVTSIAVTTPPNKTLYTSGETINFDGIVVTAYDQDNNELGPIPYEELEFPVTVAQRPTTNSDPDNPNTP